MSTTAASAARDNAAGDGGETTATYQTNPATGPHRERYAAAIGGAVARAKAGDPLAPVTVICGDWAMDDVLVALTQPGEPLINVEVTPLGRFITTAARGLGRKPLQREDVAREVSRMLADDAPATVFHAKHLNTSPATQEGLTDAIFELAALPPQWREAHGGQGLPANVAKLAQTVLERTREDCYTYPEAVEAAARGAAKRSVIVAGDVALDAKAQWAIEQLGEAVERVELGGALPKIERATFVAERDEAKFVASEIARAVEQGAALSELAVGCCDDTQIEAVARALSEAGISHRAPEDKTWAQDPYFRAVASLIRLDPEEMNRRDLAALLATGAAADAPWINTFDQVTRDDKLQFYAGADWDKDWRAGFDDRGDPGRAERVEEVVGWVHALRADLEALWASESWPGAAAALRGIAERRLRKPRGTESLFLAEVCGRLAELRGQVAQQRALDAVSGLYDRAQPQQSKGLVAVGPLASLAGRELHTAFIVGALDDTLPGSITPSATITAAQSHDSAEEFLGRRRRAFTAALASAPRVVVTNPRSHQDGSGATRPSQWVTQRGLRELSLPVPEGAAFDVAEHPQSEAMLIEGTLTALTDEDALLIDAAAGDFDPETERYSAIMGYRDAGAHGDEEGAEFNGFTHTDLRARFFDKDVSNSALESFTKSPLLFFIDRILGAYELPDEVHTLDVDARERGTHFHEIFEAWTNEVLLNPASPPDYDSEAWWESDAKPRLDAIVDRQLASSRSARVNDAVWFSFEDTVRRDVARWFAREEAELRAGWRPIAAELAFGTNPYDGTTHPSPYIEVAAPGGAAARMTFNGKIDRLDFLAVSGEPTVLRITDYKTGRQYSNVKSALADGPTGSAEKNKYYFQLALYGGLLHRRFVEEARGDVTTWFPEVAQAIGALPPVGEVQARYWYFQETKASEGEQLGVVSETIDEAVLATLEANLTYIYQFITAGVFPPHAIDAHWVETRELKVGAAQYEAVTEALAEQELIPLRIDADPEDAAAATATANKEEPR